MKTNDIDQEFETHPICAHYTAPFSQLLNLKNQLLFYWTEEFSANNFLLNSTEENSSPNNAKYLIQKKSCIKLGRHFCTYLNRLIWFLRNSQHKKQNNRNNLWRSDSTKAKEVLRSSILPFPHYSSTPILLSRIAPPLLGTSSPSPFTSVEILSILKGST